MVTFSVVILPQGGGLKGARVYGTLPMIAQPPPHSLVAGATGEILRIRQRDWHGRAGAAGGREPDGG